MIKPPLSPDEPFRLEALRRTNVLDTPLEERFERLTRLLRRTLHVPIGAISLVDADRQWFKSMQGHACTETGRDISFCAHAILDEEIMIVKDAREDPRFRGNPLVVGPPHIVFYAGCPVRSLDGLNIGVLCAIDHEPRELDDDELATLRDIAAMVEEELHATVAESVHSELLQQIEQEQRKALVDPLTRLWNREGVLSVLTEQLQASKASGAAPPVVALADIDHFKSINDRHGHPVGDEVLRDVAKRFLGGTRSRDAVGRYGGEEFLFVLTGIDTPDAAVALAERIRGSLSDAPVADGLRVTTSIGVAISGADSAADAEELVSAADVQLYRAKAEGRNCVRWTDLRRQNAALPARGN